jgi:hypothetical protein
MNINFEEDTKQRNEKEILLFECQKQFFLVKLVVLSISGMYCVGGAVMHTASPVCSSERYNGEMGRFHLLKLDFTKGE